MTYSLSLKRWQRHWPRKQLFVVNFLQLVSDANSYMKHMESFLGLKGLADIPLPHANQQG